MISLKYMTDSGDRPVTTVLFWIDRQDERSIYFKASNDWLIATESNPELDIVNETLYVRGDVAKGDHYVMGCSWETFEHVICAVQEYNRSISPQPTVESDFIPPVQTIDGV